MAHGLNLAQLEDTLQNDPENLDQLAYWYTRLSELELDGSEAPEVLERLLHACQWVMQFEHTKAEELRDFTEKSAIETAEKEENWEQEKEILKEELSALRERITSRAGFDDMNEAFRAEIDNLRAENNQLRQQGRERDRELADHQDRNEAFAAKVESLERERNVLVTNQTQLEDTVRDLHRRISSKSETSTRSDWETRKLKQRSEQAYVLSNQMENAVAENRRLQDEVIRLSDSLETATVLIRETTDKYASLKDQLTGAESTIEKLMKENHLLQAQLALKQSDMAEKIEAFQVSSKDVETLIKMKDVQIDKYRESLQKQQMELEEQRARLHMFDNQEREAELERLRQELVEATNVARQLFGSMSGDASGQPIDATAELRVRIIQLDKQLETTQHKVKELEEEKGRLEDVIVEKDELNAKVNAELKRIRQITFGDADTEIRHLEQQIEFREKQIHELTTKCSLLQIELERFQGVQPLAKPKETGAVEPPTKVPPKTGEGTRGGAVIKKPVVRPRKSLPPPVPMQRQSSSSSEQLVLEETSETHGRKEMSQKYLDDVEASALIISSLNHALMQSLLENEDKEKQLREMERVTRSHVQDMRLARAKLNRVMTELAKAKSDSVALLEAGGASDADRNKDARLEELQIKVVELERLADSIQQSDQEIHRRLEEAARKLIYVQIRNSELERKTESGERLQKTASEMVARMRDKLRRLLTGENRKLRELTRDCELNMIEIARLQNSLIHSVPLAQYDKLLLSFKSLATRAGLGTEFDERSDPAFSTDVRFVGDISVAAGTDEEAGGTMIENLKLQNVKLDQLNQVLENQNDFLRRETERQEAEIGELKAFLTDIESNTDLKSLVVNIERRFLQALKEQADSSDEQFFADKELRNIQKRFSARTKTWRQERQNLVTVISALQQTVQQLRQQTTSALRLDHLMQFKEATEKLKTRERELHEKTELVEEQLAKATFDRSNAEAQLATVQEFIDHDFNLQRLQTSIQGYHLNVRTLTAQLQESKKEIERLKQQCETDQKELTALQAEHTDLLLSQIDVTRFIVGSSDEQEDEEEERRPKADSRRAHDALEKRRAFTDEQHSTLSKAYHSIEQTDVEEDSVSLDSSATESSSARDAPAKTRTVIYDNSSEYQRQIQQIKETARLCIESYKDQLAQKEKAVEEYRRLLAEMTTRWQQEQMKAPHTPTQERPRTSEELLRPAAAEEQEKRVISLERQVRELEQLNADLNARLESVHVDAPPPKPRKDLASKPSSPPKDDFEDDFESDSDPEDAKPSGPSGLPPPLSPDSHTKEPQMRSDSPSSSKAEDDDGSSETDSGTVEDIEERRRHSRSSSRSSSADNARKLSSENVRNSSAASKKPPSRAGTTIICSGADEREQIIYRQRNEIRKLRERVGGLDRKVKELTAECESWKKRKRFGGKREHDPNAETVALAKENERIKRESKNLTRTLENQKRQIDELQKAAAKRNVSQSKEVVESWEEKKKREKLIASLKKQIEEAHSRETELSEKLERHEKHLEQIQRERSTRTHDGEQTRQLLQKLRSETKAAEQREQVLVEDKEKWIARSKDTMLKLEQCLRETKVLRTQLEKAHVHVQELEEKLAARPEPPPPIQVRPPSPPRIHYPPPKPAKSVQTQTASMTSPSDTARYISSRRTTDERPSLPSPDRTELTELRKQLRLFEYQAQERQEEFEKLQLEYQSLQETYSNLVRTENARKRKFELAVVPILTDKLKAKDKELETQRRKILILETEILRSRNLY